MASESTTGVHDHIQTLFQHGALGGLTDGQLLERFITGHAGAAEAIVRALVERHGPMVLRVCRDVLGDAHDAADASQAVFLVLARRAGTVRRHDSAASWLFGVARRVAGRARRDAARRRKHEGSWAEMRARHTEIESTSDSWEELYQEIERLPAKYRAAIVLCHLEGQTHEQAAGQLGCPLRTLQSRLLRARALLRTRLTRHGLALPMGLLAAGFSPRMVSATMQAAFWDSTVRAATLFAARKAMTTAPVPQTVVALAQGILQMMFWSKLRAAGLVGLSLAALVGGTGVALAYQDMKKEGRIVPSEARPQAPAPPIVKTPDAARPVDAQAAVILALPPGEELHRLLRLAAGEAVALAKINPRPSSWTLTTIATAQARAGDLDGARTTFAEAAREAEGGPGGTANAWGLWRVGHSQAESGLNAKSRATLQRAFKALPAVAGEYDKDSRTVETFALIAQDQALIGAREDAHTTVDRLLEFSREFFESTNIGNARDVAAPKVAAALAAAGDFDAALRWSEGVQNGGNVLGKIAEAASRSLDRESALRFVREAADRLAKLATADQTYFGLSDLAEAQARLGDVEAARRSARAIGEGPSRADYDMTDGQPYALLRVAIVQRKAGDTAGARQTLRDGFRTVSEHPRMRFRDGRYGQIADGQIASGDADGAVKTVEAMEGRRSGYLASIARAQAAAGEHAAARATFARALDDAGLSVKNPPEPNQELAKMPGVSQVMPAAARSELAEIQAMAGDIPGALKTLRSITDPLYQRIALGKVISARATTGDVAGVLRLALDESRTAEERRSAFEGLGRGVETRLSLNGSRGPEKARE